MSGVRDQRNHFFLFKNLRFLNRKKVVFMALDFYPLPSIMRISYSIGSPNRSIDPNPEGVAMKLYFVRHGESVANVLHEFSNSGIKHPLTEKGVEQAHALAHTCLACRSNRFTPARFLRAVQTAQILRKACTPRCRSPRRCANGAWHLRRHDRPAWLGAAPQVTEDWIFHQKAG